MAKPDKQVTHAGSSAMEPGRWVRNPNQPDWGVGQVQSAVGDRLTVNFEHAGKLLVNAGAVALEILDGPPAD